MPATACARTAAGEPATDSRPSDRRLRPRDGARARGRGLLSVVGVLGALYPAVTVLLARGVLGERLTRTQDAGVMVTLAGVLAMAAGA